MRYPNKKVKRWRSEVPVDVKLLANAKAGYYRQFGANKTWLTHHELHAMLVLVGVTAKQWEKFTHQNSSYLYVHRHTLKKLKVLAGPQARYHAALFKLIDTEKYNG